MDVRLPFEGPLAVLLQHISDGVTVQDASGRLIFANEAAARSAGFASPAAMLATPPETLLDAFNIRDDKGRPFDRNDLPGRVALRTGQEAIRTLYVRGEDEADERTWEVQAFPEQDADGHLLHVVNICRDVTRERQTEEQLRLRARRQFRIAELGRKALAGTDIPTLMDEITAIVALKLTVPFACILEHRPNHGHFVVRSVTGWPDSAVGDTIPDAPEASIGPFTLATGAPVTSPDIASDPRFGSAELLRQVGAVSGLCVPIRHLGQPFGTLGAYTDRPYAFTEDDVYFLESVANILAAAIERRDAENAIRESEKRLKMALDAGRMGTWEWNILTDEVHWSESIEAIHGVPPGSFGGSFEAYQSDMHPDDKDHVLDTIHRVIEEGGEYEIQYRILPPDGSVRWIEAKGRLMYHDGRPARLTGTCMDISERKRFEEERARLYEAARAAEQRSAFLAEASKVLGASLDYETTLASVARLVTPALADWCVVHVLERGGSLRTVSVTHTDPAKAAWAAELEERYPPDPDRPAGLGSVILTGQPELVKNITDDDIRSVARNPEHAHLLRSTGMHTAMLVPMAAGDKIVGTVTFIRAETPRPYSEQDLTLAVDLGRRCAVAIENARLYEEIRWADRAKDEFLAMLSHELRNPLGAIANGVLVLETVGAQTPEARQQRDMLARQVRNMTRLLDDLLDVSRSTRGRVQLQRSPADLRDVLTDAVEAMRPSIEARELEFTLAAPPESIPVFADRTRLEQVFCNLLGNATKYTDQGGRIRIEAGTENGAAVVRLTDSGIGIPQDLLPHVFDLFTQAERSLDRSQGGLGIGLTLVKSLVELHGGTVTAYSAGPGHGSVFTVRLPLSAESSQADASDGAAQPPRTAVARVLLVEDNEDAADSLSAILEMWGCTVQVVHDGPAALTAVPEFQPDVVLLDIGLPGMDGYEVARRLRAGDDIGDARLVAVTGYGREEDRRAARAAGFDDCLPKPVDIEGLKKIVT